MYAAYQHNGPSRTSFRTTAFASENNLATDTARQNSLSGRILTYCVAGTFGLLSPSYLYASSATANWDINKIEFNESKENTVSQIRESARDIIHIRDATKISISELARVFGVSRQAVHEWIKGSALSPQNAQRLSELAQATDILLQSEIEISPQIFRRKIADGPSLFDALKEDSNVVDLARTLSATLVRESEQRKRLAARFSGRSQSSKSAEDFGSPHLNEDA